MDNLPENSRYIFDETCLVSEVDRNCVFFKTLAGKYKLTGNDITLAFRRIISCFQTESSVGDVVKKLGGTYTRNTVEDLIAYLVSHKVLISDREHRDLASFDPDFVEKYRYLVSENEGLADIASTMDSLTIGFVCNHQVAEYVMDRIRNDRLIKKISMLITDRSSVPDDFSTPKAEVACLGDAPDRQVDELIEKCGIIIACSNYECFSLFSYINEKCLEKGKKWIRAVVADECGEAGPLFVPGETCCYSCLNKRAEDNMSTKTNKVYFNLQREQEAFSTPRLGSFSSSYFTQVIVDIVLYEMMKLFSGHNCALKGSVFTFIPGEYDVSVNKCFRDSKCTSCH